MTKTEKSPRPAERRTRVLVIEDDEHMRGSLQESLTRRGFDIVACPDGPSGLARCQDETFDVILCDLKMPGMSGVEVCARLGDIAYAAPIVVITAYGSVETAVEAMRNGAYDYITKPFKGDQLQAVIEKAIRHAALLRENRTLRVENRMLKTEVSGCAEGAILVGESQAVERVRRLVERYAASSATVLVRGESGVGKEVVARLIHQRSARRNHPFLCVNCAALSAGLLESELFGHEKGAFTGADSRREGRFEIADGGTLLLDEVSEIEPRLQSKLLRVLQERTFERVGSSRSIKSDVRVIATSNRELEEEVRRGRFREDLFFRLNVLPIEIPPLRQRKEDIVTLVRYFLEKIRRRSGGESRRLDPAAEKVLMEYDWPGNVRELENVLERAWVLADGRVIGVDALPGIVTAAGVTITKSREVDADAGLTLDSFRGMPLKKVERILIRDALARYGGHQKRTAGELGIGVRTLRTKIKKWNLQSGEAASEALDEAPEEETGTAATASAPEGAGGEKSVAGNGATGDGATGDGATGESATGDRRTVEEDELVEANR